MDVCCQADALKALFRYSYFTVGAFVGQNLMEMSATGYALASFEIFISPVHLAVLAILSDDELWRRSLASFLTEPEQQLLKGFSWNEKPL